MAYRPRSSPRISAGGCSTRSPPPSQKHGYGAAVIADAIAIAGVSRKTFYELYADKEECFLAAYERWLGPLVGETKAAFESASGSPWAERLRVALEALLARLAADPDAAWAFIVEVHTAGPRAVARREAALRELAELVDLGRSAAPYNPPGVISAALVGGVEELIRSHLLHGAAAQLPGQLPDVLFFLTQPLLGSEAAATERERARELLAGAGG